MPGSDSRQSVKIVLVNWTAPLNPQYDIAGYTVNICVNGNCTTRQTDSNTVSYQEYVIPGDEVCVNVSTVTTCADQAGGVSEPTNSTCISISK